MAKIKVDGLPGWEFEGGTDPRAKELDRWVKERRGDTSVLESAEGRAAKGEREKLVLGALGVKVEEKKTQDKGKETDAKRPFEDLRAQLKDLAESLAREGITYYPLTEFRQKLESWSDTISLKESDSDDLNSEFSDVKKSSLKIVDEIRDFHRKKK